MFKPVFVTAGAVLALGACGSPAHSATPQSQATASVSQAADAQLRQTVADGTAADAIPEPGQQWTIAQAATRLAVVTSVDMLCPDPAPCHDRGVALHAAAKAASGEVASGVAGPATASYVTTLRAVTQ